MSELKPCPFCGSEADYQHFPSYPDYIRVHCINAECPACDISATSEDWNNRHEATVSVTALRKTLKTHEWLRVPSGTGHLYGAIESLIDQAESSVQRPDI